MSNRLANKFVADLNSQVNLATQKHLNKLLVVLISKLTSILKTILRKEYYGNSNNNQYVYLCICIVNIRNNLIDRINNFW